MLSTGKILELTQQKISAYVADRLPIVVAMADPKRIKVGISLQRDYPLTMIERRYGVPYGHLRSNAGKPISDADELHACKWSIEVHEAVFQVDAMNEAFIRGTTKASRPIVILSTGLGNVLQNRRSIAYENGKLHHVMGEKTSDSPYTCLVEYSDGEPMLGVELLLFPEAGGYQMCSKLTHQPEKGGREIRWAVSGYPLVLAGKRVNMQQTANEVSDYRHLWRLPKLTKSLVARLAKLSGTPKIESKIELYFAFDFLDQEEYFLPACRAVTFSVPLDFPASDKWMKRISDVCNIPLDEFKIAFPNEHIEIQEQELVADFQDAGYTCRTDGGDLEIGQFFIHSQSRRIHVRLLPAIYPHHIVGMTKDGRLANISVAGRSGRSGLTIESAKDLATEIELTDALIFDNGFDVFSRIAGGAIVCHADNIRQTRLTAALQFGSFPQSRPNGVNQAPPGFGTSFDGFELSMANLDVEPARQHDQK